MKLIYTSPDRLMVWGAKNALELAGYCCHIRNEYAVGAAGDIAPIDTWPEVWLDDDEQFDKAKEYLQSSVLKPGLSGQDWYCRHCGEINGAAFEFCWHCGCKH